MNPSLLFYSHGPIHHLQGFYIIWYYTLWCYKLQDWQNILCWRSFRNSVAIKCCLLSNRHRNVYSTAKNLTTHIFILKSQWIESVCLHPASKVSSKVLQHFKSREKRDFNIKFSVKNVFLTHSLHVTRYKRVIKRDYCIEFLQIFSLKLLLAEIKQEYKSI